MGLLDGRTAVVTGAGRGIGAAVAVADATDVTDFEACERLIGRAVDEFGRLDILCNVAGILRDGMIFKMPEEDFDAVVGVHLKGTFNTTRHASAYWRENRCGH